ncbi:MAG: mycoredoxin-dependent peroxiredoxin [Actinomycetota bacterium]|jgi:peroxiredoxin (alkyl hydroperoxide reductase subunit C)|nr:mycoredoxin-dependent peroxiredoxin [Actinomycetota bacterium]
MSTSGICSVVPTELLVGQVAPEFTLKDQHGKSVSLSDYKGNKNVLIVFYPFAFSGICSGELSEIRDNLGDFESDDVQVLVVSCDHMFSQRAWSDVEGFFFPMLSDFWPHGGVAQAYGVFDQDGGFATRGTFLIDSDGIVRWTLVNGTSQKRDFAGYRAALKELAGSVT